MTILKGQPFGKITQCLSFFYLICNVPEYSFNRGTACIHIPFVVLGLYLIHDPIKSGRLSTYMFFIFFSTPKVIYECICNY